TISNPLVKVCDIETCAEIARQVGARLIIDNTFASPILCHPLEFGADFSVHSATKYLSGHADAMGGIVIAREEFDMTALIGAMKLIGGILSPWEAHSILRGIKTLALRMERQCRNAFDLAKHLSLHKAIKRVHYPALQPGHALSRIIRDDINSNFGGAILSIQLADDTREGAFRFMNRLQLCVCATSLGDVFTGALHPATVSHREVSPAQRQRLGISDGLVRLSLGIENVADIIADVDQALESVKQKASA
ncbi:MAG: trans-sulfuration enzyme family protein, partial [Pyrinomonadaceae bacterium]